MHRCQQYELSLVLFVPVSYTHLKVVEFNSLEHGYRPEKFQYHIDPILKICEEHGLIVKVFTGQGFYTMPEQWVFYSRRFPKVTFEMCIRDRQMPVTSSVNLFIEHIKIIIH